MNPVTNPHCLLCNSRIGVSNRNAVEIFNIQNKNHQSDKLLASSIGDILECKLDKQNVHSLIICKKCHKLSQEYEELELRCKEIKTEITTQYKKSQQKNAIEMKMADTSSENMENYNEASKTDKTANEENKDDNMDDSKLNTLSKSKKIAPVPTNLIIVGPKGKKIAVQKPLLKSPEPVRSITTKITDTEVKKQIDQVELQMQKIHDIEDSSPNDEIIIINNIKNLKKENDDKDLDDDENEYLDDFDHIMIKAEDPQNDDEYVISKVEVVESNITLEETEDEDIIKLIRHPDKDLLEDDQGNFYRTDEDGNIEMILPDQDSDEHFAETIDLKDGGSIIKFSPALINKNILKNKRLNEILDLDDDDKNASRDSLEIDPDGLIDSLDGSKKLKRNENLYSCLVCHSENPDKEKNKNEDSEKMDLDNEEEEPMFLGDARMIIEHMKEVHDTVIFICDVCGYIRSTKEQMDEHFLQHLKTKLGEFMCDICHKILDSQELLKKHRRTMHKSKNFTCNICKKKFSSNIILEEHLNIHKGFRPYNCHFCGKTFSSKYTHQSHLKTHKERPRPFTCSQCGKSFLSLQNLTQHEKTHLGIKDYICKICGKAFGTQHNLEIHGVVHTGFKPYKCETCGKGFARRAEIRDHERIHTGERPYQCDICGASFSQRSNLQSHKRATHFNDKRYKCGLCEKSFKRRRLLEYHIKSTHTGERPFRCSVCDATFVYPEHFKKHQRIHSGEKPYKCEVCHKAFNSRDNRNAHRFVHSDKKPYECLDCGAGFMRKPMLYAHMHSQGHLSDTIVVNQPRLNGDLVGSFDSMNNFVVENATEETNAKDNIKESNFDQNIPIIVSAMADHSEDGTIIKTESEIIPGEEAYLENTEATIDDDMLDPQRIEIIDTESTQEVGEFIQSEDGTVKLVQIELADGERAWVAID